MCRLLYVRSQEPFGIGRHLQKLAEIARASKEYQGDGWGCAYLAGGEWTYHHDIAPIWEDDLDRFGETTCLVAHARSAFRQEEIGVENNMPFHDERYVFVFNGELRGVRLQEKGRIGAEKIFNFVKRFDKGDMLTALKKGVGIIRNRTEYVRALNLVIADKDRAYVASTFGEDPDYFTLRSKTSGSVLICSEPYAGEKDWEPIPNNSVRAF